LAERRSQVHEAAVKFGLPVLHPGNLKGEAAAATFRSHNADAAVVVAYGLLLPKAILEAPKFGCLNLHASLLPRWRGAAPIARAVMAGDAETGVMVMKMDEGLDTGPVALAERVAIGPDMTAGELHDKLAPLGADLMVRALAALGRGALEFKPQAAAGVTYAKKIEKGETRIDWSKPWKQVHDHIRGLSPFPGAWFQIGDARVKTLRSTRGEGSGAPGTVLDDRLTIACKEGAVRLLEVQRAGAKADECRVNSLRGFAGQGGNEARLTMPRATKSSSSMTARRSSAGRFRTTVRRWRARSPMRSSAFRASGR
jgi:methionyl-tRNA formyltransferase